MKQKEKLFIVFVIFFVFEDYYPYSLLSRDTSIAFLIIIIICDISVMVLDGMIAAILFCWHQHDTFARTRQWYCMDSAERKDTP